MKDFHRSKSGAVSFRPWVEYVKEFLKEQNMAFDMITNEELYTLYHQDRSPTEVYYYIRMNCIKSASVVVRWQDDFGSVEMVFTNNEALKDFYRINPKLKKSMDFEK